MALVAGLVCAAGASASVLGLPADGSQVNNDPAHGIDAQQDAGQSDVGGGSLAAGGSRVPWGTFEQKSGSAQQIFVRAFKNGQWVTQGGSLNMPRPVGGLAGTGWQRHRLGQQRPDLRLQGVKQAAPNSPCAGFKPSAAASVSAFCWQQVGADRLAADNRSSATGDPSLNVDPSNGIEPDIAFTGPSDKVAWTVWYETGSSALGLRGNDQVFAAKIIADPGADGGFHWQAVGRGTGQTNPLDTSANPPRLRTVRDIHQRRGCLLAQCHPTLAAEDPRVASGTLTPGSPTVPWVVWAEDTGSGNHAIFISRLVGGDHFELFNGGAPLSPLHRDATHPDITFFGNVPYISWIEVHGDRNRGFVGHFENGAFVLDTPRGIGRAPRFHRASLIDARVPLSSSCTADPFTNDAQACPVAPVNSPFDLFTTAEHPQQLFGQALIGGPNCVIFAHCRLQITHQADGAEIDSDLAADDNVGILVQRITRARRIHGHRVLVLRTVGRVPLGHHHNTTTGPAPPQGAGPRPRTGHDPLSGRHRPGMIPDDAWPWQRVDRRLAACLDVSQPLSRDAAVLSVDHLLVALDQLTIAAAR